MRAANLTHLWYSLSMNAQIGLMIAAIVIPTAAVIIVRQKIRKSKVESFLFNNGYHAENPQTKKLVFPKVIFGKDKIVIKNCIRKTAEQIQNEKALWQQTFHFEIRGKKIGEVRFEGRRIVMALL